MMHNFLIFQYKISKIQWLITTSRWMTFPRPFIFFSGFPCVTELENHWAEYKWHTFTFSMVCDGWGQWWCGGGVARGTQVLVTCFFCGFFLPPAATH